MDPETGLIQLKRDDAWLNGYNPWIMLMLRANHDCKFLFSQVYALAIIHYVMKYISKPEHATHAKLTIAAAVRQELAHTNSDLILSTTTPVSKGKQMLSKVYNRLDSHREVGIPEAISHLCGFPDHYTSATFININTKTLLSHMKRCHQQFVMDIDRSNALDDDSEVFDSEILSTRHGYRLMSPFDDYIYRGEHLSQICLYDYFSLFYKDRGSKGIQFHHIHPQADTHCQILRRSTVQVPNLLGRLLFLRPDSEDKQMKEDYYCLLGDLFVPWTHDQSLNPSATSWQDWYLNQATPPPPYIARLIKNLELLHKSKDEVQFDRLQRASLDGDDDVDSPDYNEEDEAILNAVDDDDDDDEMHGHNSSTTDLDPSLSLEQIEAAALDMDTGFYVQEALDAGCDYNYFDNSPPTESTDGAVHESDEEGTIFLTHLSSRRIGAILEELTARLEGPDAQSRPIVRPCVYLSWGPRLNAEIQGIVEQFSLNEEQVLAFAIVARQSCRRHQIAANASVSVDDCEPQLLMGLFGEGGTGKSRVISAICKWFQTRGMSDELLITATTGSAAVKIGGQTLHSAIGLKKDGKAGKVSKRIMDLWFNRQYLVIDEVSMMDAKLLSTLHTQLVKIKSNPDLDFGGVNILYAGDFLQLPSVSHQDVYLSDYGDRELREAHLHWRKLNAVVILKQQMRQAEDQRYAELLSRLRRRCPTDEDLALLYSRVGAPLPPSALAPLTIVRRNNLRHAINSERLQQMAALKRQQIVYCIAKVLSKAEDINLNGIHGIRQSTKPRHEDGVLALIPGAPLLITQNIDSSLGEPPMILQVGINDFIGLVNGALVEFYGFVGARKSLSDNRIFYPPQYMLVKIRDGPASEVRLRVGNRSVLPTFPGPTRPGFHAPGRYRSWNNKKEPGSRSDRFI